jgi:hypothetical protein
LLYIRIAVIVLGFMIISCGERGDVNPARDWEDPAVVVHAAKEKLGDNVAVAQRGNFNADSLLEIAAGIEIENGGIWGIQFVLLEQRGEDLEEIFRSSLLEGSFEESTTEKIKFTANEYEMLYYSSEDYFLGSGGGEVFSYIVDFQQKEVYYAHLISEERGVSLFLSDNFRQEDVKNFFVTKFKRDYPNLTIVTEDINLSE